MGFLRALVLLWQRRCYFETNPSSEPNQATPSQFQPALSQHTVASARSKPPRLVEMNKRIAHHRKIKLSGDLPCFITSVVILTSLALRQRLQLPTEVAPNSVNLVNSSSS